VLLRLISLRPPAHQPPRLQDQVPAFDSATSVAIVEAELGAPVEQLFERFDPIPIAAASLGQVHRACLNNQEVVVKVQRPGLKDLFDIDLKNLRVRGRLPLFFSK
jgi:predicted unusual protein kinase regulating ubiquinone biosynthesis (AarF/ABC1/UbiB family)